MIVEMLLQAGATVDLQQKVEDCYDSTSFFTWRQDYELSLERFFALKNILKSETSRFPAIEATYCQMRPQATVADHLLKGTFPMHL